MSRKFLQQFRLKKAAAAEDWQAPWEAAAKALREQRFETAIQLYTKVIEHRENHAEAYYKRANCQNALGRLENALADYDQAVALDPTHAHAYCNRGTVLQRMARWDDALASYDIAVSLDAGDFLVFYNRGSALKELRRFDEALASYDRAIELKNDYPAALINRGNVLHRLRRYEAAIGSYDRAIGLDDGIPEAHQGRGISLLGLRRFQEALASFDRAILLRAGYAEAHSNRGGVLQEMGQHEAALTSYDRAIELNPDFAAALQGRGFSLVRLQRFEAAIQSYERAMALEADRRYLCGMRLHAQMQICDWSNLPTLVQRLTAGLQAKAPVSVPLPVLAVADSPALHRSAAEVWAERECPRDGSLGPIAPRDRGRKIQVAYFSSDFCEHAVSLVAAELFEMHDRSRYQITAFSFGPKPDDPMRARLRTAFDRFIDVHDRSDRDIAMMARSLGIDIAVDLNGYTEYSRTNIFALRAAPIQINYLGYPGTMGSEYMEYLIADRMVVPEGQQRHYAEKIIYLPHSYLPHDSTRSIATTEFTPQELGLPNDGFVFCCFNNSYKITPDVFSCWMRMLGRTDGSVLWLLQNDPATARHLRYEAQRRGIAPERLIFARRVDSLAQHLARLRCADLFLDTLPYNAHATASDALWAGLPLITRRGESFAARVAASLLTAIGMPELIASTEQQYEDLGVELAANPQRLREIGTKLSQVRSSAPLFNTRAFAGHLETAYEMILERHYAGLPPDHIHVPQ